MKCVKCGAEQAEHEFKVLQVQTLHVRDLNKEKRVQALGEFEEYGVCESCIKDKYDSIVDNRAQIRKTWLIYGSLMAVGALLTYFYWSGDIMFRLIGWGLLIGSVLCLLGGLKSANAKKRALLMLSDEEAVEQCAWEAMIDGAPKKNDINDITYIPVNEKTKARKNGDLMILYDLLPEIAIEAHKRIHEQ